MPPSPSPSPSTLPRYEDFEHPPVGRLGHGDGEGGCGVRWDGDDALAGSDNVSLPPTYEEGLRALGWSGADKRDSCRL